MMRRQFNNIVSVLYSAVRFAIVKLFASSSFKFSGIQRFSPDVVVEISRKGKLTLGSSVRVHRGSQIKVVEKGELTIGRGAKINSNCFVVCMEHIDIGAGVEFGPNVFLYDHDHDYRAGLKKTLFKTGSIEIGENSWIGANTVILRGTKIGKNCVVAAGSVIRGEFPDNSIIYQKRETSIRHYNIEG